VIGLGFNPPIIEPSYFRPTVGPYTMTVFIYTILLTVSNSLCPVCEGMV